GLGLLEVVTEDDVLVGAQGAEQIVGRQYLQPERVQFQIPDDPWMQQAHHVGKPGGAKSRAELLGHGGATHDLAAFQNEGLQTRPGEDRKSTRLNSSHRTISYAVFCLKKKKKRKRRSN